MQVLGGAGANLSGLSRCSCLAQSGREMSKLDRASQLAQLLSLARSGDNMILFIALMLNVTLTHKVVSVGGPHMSD